MHPQIRLQYLTGYPGLAYPHYRGGGGAGHPGGGAPNLPQQQHHQLHQKQDDQGETVLSANGLAGNISFLTLILLGGGVNLTPPPVVFFT